jgi:transcription antitermination protein NusB
LATSRREARGRALALLFEADVRARPAAEIVDGHAGVDDPPPAFAVEIVRGVSEHRQDLDALISLHAQDWRLDRMPVVDRNVLRIGAWELLHTDVPTAVAIDEAVELAKELSTDASGRFVNGVLARIAKDRTDGSPARDAG